MKELTTSELAQELGVEPSVLRKWNYRGFLKKAPQGVPGQRRGRESMWSEEAQLEASTFSKRKMK